MFTSLTAPGWADDVAGQRRRNRATEWYGYAGCFLLSLVMALLAYTMASETFSLASLLVFATIALCVTCPRWGVYAVVFLAMLGDASTFPTYPFTKNLSSRESMLYVGDGLTISPLELCLAALVLGWVLSMLATRRWTLYRGPLFTPMACFGAFVFLGLVWGVGRGGDRVAAFWEVRPLLVLVVLFLLVTNLLETPKQYRRLFWLVLIAATLNSLVALAHYHSLPGYERAGLESLGEHGASIQAAAVLVFLAAAWVLRDGSWSARWIVPFMAVPVTWAFLLSERRAGMIALLGGFVVVGMVLRWRDRRRFWMVAPIVVLVSVGYFAAMWNASGIPGFPSQALKSVIAPDDQTEEDKASDFYRDIENFDVLTTIKANPVTGVGFGQKFYRPWPLPSISFFVFWEYITHNSILWIWMKAGIGGFLAMLCTFALALRNGARTLVNPDSRTDLVLTVTSVAYIVMFGIFAYVDIAWDNRNVVLLAVALAQIDRAARARSAADEPRPTAAVVPVNA